MTCVATIANTFGRIPQICLLLMEKYLVKKSIGMGLKIQAISMKQWIAQTGERKMIEIADMSLVRPSQINSVKRSRWTKRIPKGLFKKDELETIYRLEIRLDDNTKYGFSQKFDYTNEEDRDKEFSYLKERLKEEE